MKRLLFLSTSKSFRYVQYSSFPIVVGSIEDNYLPTKFDKKEKTVTIFGSTGFFGEFLINELAKQKYQIIIPYRGDVYDCKHLRMIGGVGQNLFMPFSIEDSNSIMKAIEYSDAVINLIGQNYENQYMSFKELHVDVAAKIARICQSHGIKNFVQMSALGACEHPHGHILKSGSKFLRTKWLGEKEVLREFPDAVIIRPSNIWGLNDHFIYYYFSRKRVNYGKKIRIPLWKLGQETIKQPVFAEDVAKAIGIVLFNDRYRGRVIETVGPQRFQLDHLVKWFFLNKKHKLEDIEITEISDWLLFKSQWGHLITAVIPHVTADGLERECVTDQLNGGVTLENLGIVPNKMESRMQWLIKPFRCIGYKWDHMGGFHPPPSPPLAL